ncbi:helix-turn-helix domain-containing protein [Paenibacillus senegalensis]|uniref:helix-turn-helix domain-containing protein n=1 Tax=Paenibacillus senegalensis TaxID=1465766 RepID=UPI000288580F|nr:helix-turn-helix domain-containing protein [Paenibacillus senegalensis]
MNWFKVKGKSLFTRIFSSFLIVIILLSAFTLFSFTYLKSTIQNEIIQYNRLILDNAVDRYRNHFTTIRSLVFDLHNNPNLIAYNRQLTRMDSREVDYLLATKFMRTLRTNAYNPHNHLDNLLVHFNSSDYVLDKEGGSSSQHQFVQFYSSSEYPHDFWRALFDTDDSFTILPSAEFSFKLAGESGSKTLLPVVYKRPDSNYQVIAFLDMRQLMLSFLGEHAQGNGQLIILDENSRMLYNSIPEHSDLPLEELLTGTQNSLLGDYYYFTRKDQSSGWTYISIVPYSHIALQMQKLNWTLVLILLVTIIIGMAVSYWLSQKIHSPVKKMISSILEEKPGEFNSNIHEFSLVGQKIGTLFDEKKKIQEELLNNQSFLTSYGYISKLKMINSDIQEWKQFIASDEKFTIIMYQLNFHDDAFQELEIQSTQAINYIREHINLLVSDYFPGSHTFQLEKDQILSVVNGPVAAGQIEKLLELLKTILDRDKSFCQANITVSATYPDSSYFNKAYEDVLAKLRQAPLHSETQLIYEARQVSRTVYFTSAQEEEFYNHLLEGHDLVCFKMISRLLEQMEHKEAAAFQYRQLAEGIVSKTITLLKPDESDENGQTLEQLSRQIPRLFTVGQYKKFFQAFLEAAAEIARNKKSGKDPIIDFVMDWLSTRYHEEVSLEMLADKLNLSSAYLSVYIKEKTGTNFIDHLNGIRMNKAKELLTKSDKPIVEISRDIGYRNVTSFNRMFKKWTGVSPSEYRKQQVTSSPEIPE